MTSDADRATLTSSTLPASPPPPLSPTSNTNPTLNSIKSFIAGGIAGSLAKTCIAPLERTKILMQVSQMYGWYDYGSLSGAMKEIVRKDGLLGFFRGNAAAIARIFPYR